MISGYIAGGDQPRFGSPDLPFKILTNWAGMLTNKDRLQYPTTKHTRIIKGENHRFR
jgi:hypothetical protein